jgi:AbrB family looped-hinge helix DNA binding protein
MSAATFTQKGQIVIPAEIRAQYELTPATQLEFAEVGFPPKACYFIHLRGVSRSMMRKPRTVAKNVATAIKFATRTNIVLDARLVARVKRLAGASTTREAVQVALDHYARSRDYSRVLSLQGSGGVAEGYDPKAVYPSRTR